MLYVIILCYKKMYITNVLYEYYTNWKSFKIVKQRLGNK